MTVAEKSRRGTMKVKGRAGPSAVRQSLWRSGAGLRWQGCMWDRCTPSHTRSAGLGTTPRHRWLLPKRGIALHRRSRPEFLLSQSLPMPRKGRNPGDLEIETE
ncbi:hypothetical protein SKAU_G00044510 [Synaphobranchus kaupii]|uniref:Uncharacterized protein n=1 Tax=Synaphobranchus kaupii TaxID=118154 RepID=A0A9Q1G270_SYNKA|nr:hypothetical protein SKAU_G00044510 [Synaphobranchus kaupii]